MRVLVCVERRLYSYVAQFAALYFTYTHKKTFHVLQRKHYFAMWTIFFWLLLSNTQRRNCIYFFCYWLLISHYLSLSPSHSFFPTFYLNSFFLLYNYKHNNKNNLCFFFVIFCCCSFLILGWINERKVIIIISTTLSHSVCSLI